MRICARRLLLAASCSLLAGAFSASCDWTSFCRIVPLASLLTVSCLANETVHLASSTKNRIKEVTKGKTRTTGYERIPFLVFYISFLVFNLSSFEALLFASPSLSSVSCAIYAAGPCSVAIRESADEIRFLDLEQI